MPEADSKQRGWSPDVLVFWMGGGVRHGLIARHILLMFEKVWMVD
jgi:hypoxanthine phosphoribosyltransferase